MRVALQRPAMGQTAVARSIPAPVDGWNTEDALTQMKPTYAVVLDNWIPRGGRVEMRRGFIDQVTGTSDPVETLITYTGANTGDVMFACAGANIYDVTDAGPLGSVEYASAETARWNWTNFANDAGRFVLMCNGEQTPLKHNGSTFSTNAITGTSGSITLDDDDLKYVFIHQRRVHWLEKERLRVWFLPVTAISGASSLLDLGPVLGNGGYFVGGATWSRDNGQGGLDDLAVYVTSEGQAAVYQGTDPGDVNAWALVGTYEFAKPVGDRPLLKDGGELCIVTQEGLVPLSALVATKRESQKSLMRSRKIASAWSNAATNYGDQLGWEVSYYPGRGGLTIVNVPTEENVSAMQFVQGAERGAWARFTGLNAFCWGQANGMIYFGRDDGVFRWDVGASDNSEAIIPDVLPAFSGFGNGTIIKEFTLVRALLYAPSIVVPTLDVVVEYDQTTLPTAVQTTVTPGDISPDDGTTIRNEWTGAAGVGYVASPRMRFALTGANDTARVSVTSDLTSLLLQGPGGAVHILTRPNLPLDVPVELIGFDLTFKAGGLL